MALRYQAAVDYVTSMEDISLAELQSREPYCSAVGIKAIERWSREDGWRERRMKFMREMQAEAERKLHGGLVQARVKELERMQRIAQSMVDDILGTDEYPGVSPKSKEGMVSSLVRLLDSADQVHPTFTGQDQGRGQVAAQLSDEEARAAAEAIIRQRREKIRGELADRRKQLPPGEAEASDE
jgi:hypothetical protein